MKVKFWLLDLNYEEKAENPEIWMWGIREDGKRILVVDRSFKPYFHVTVSENSLEEVLREILKLKVRGVLDCIPQDMKMFGKPVKAVKIVCRSPDEVGEIAKDVKRIRGVTEVYGDDIRFTLRYLIDMGIKPCSWIEVECEKADGYGGVKVYEVYLATAPPRNVEEELTPNLKVLALWITCMGEAGSPKPERDPIIIISTLNCEGVEKNFIAEGDEKPSDAEIIVEFTRYVDEYDPDIIVSYGSNARIIPYLLERAKRNRVKLSIDRQRGEPHASLYGHISITGRINLDLFDYAEEFQEVKVKSLENIAEYLGVMDASEIIEEYEVQDYWKDPLKRGKLIDYSMKNARRVMGIYKAISDFAIQLSQLVGLPLDFVGTAAVGFRVEWFLIRKAHEMGELVPKRREIPYQPYAGAIVLQPKPGLHEKVAVIDFRSMYPSIMLKYNVSPDTYIPPEEAEPECGVYIAPEVGHRFRREPPGFYRDVLKSLMEARSMVREKLKKIAQEDPLYKVLDARQKAIKVISNAMYGYAGWTGARWYIKQVAEAVTAWGRSLISSALKMAEELNLKVIYGDTDSIFVKYEPEKVEKLVKRVEGELGFEARVDKVYVRILFTEAKKRYCGLMEDGKLDFVGLEVVRGDWAEVAKKAQEGVLEIIMRGGGTGKAIEYVKEYINGMRRGEKPLKEYIIWKTLTKGLEEYEVRAPHVQAAKMLMEKGYTLTLGDKVGYIITLGSGKLYEKAKPYQLASKNELDIEYYISNQVIPAISRILEPLGVNVQRILSSGTTRTLMDYIKKERTTT